EQAISAHPPGIQRARYPRARADRCAAAAVDSSRTAPAPSPGAAGATSARCAAVLITRAAWEVPGSTPTTSIRLARPARMAVIAMYSASVPDVVPLHSIRFKPRSPAQIAMVLAMTLL